MLENINKRYMLNNMKKIDINSFHEPIFKSISFNYKGYQCLVNRYSSATQSSVYQELKKIIRTTNTKDTALLEVSLMMFWFCGYVYIPLTDPLIKKVKVNNNVEDWLAGNVTCHFGLTYIAKEYDDNGNHCYKLGFDCNHFTDNTMPFSNLNFGEKQYTWNFSKVTNEVKKMVNGIIEMSK